MNAATPWHRLLGMVLTDLFTGRPWRVELEQELALKSQRLDVLIIERQPGVAAAPLADDLAGLPDGLEGLAAGGTHRPLRHLPQAPLHPRRVGTPDPRPPH